jgi:serine protease Do
MMDVERGPCPRCGEAVALAARVCPHCQGSALVDVRLDAPAGDERRRYRAARALGALGLPGLTLTAALAALAAPRSTLAAGLTREDARRALAVLREQGLAAREEPAAETASAARSPAGRGAVLVALAGAAVLVLALAFAGVLLWNAENTGPGAAPAAEASTGPAPGAPLTTRQIAEKATPATVSVRGQDSVGAGFFVAADLVLTNAHVVPAGEALVQVIFADGRRLAAQVQRRDEWLDLAVLKAVGARAPALAMGDASALGAGDKVVMIGSPRGLDFTVHEGSVSHAGRNSYGLAYIQIDANVNPGNSGGPLLDEQGRVVGVVSMMVGRSSGLGMVLPINYAYDGEGALIPPPRPGPDLAAWRGLLAQVAEADRKEVAEIAEGFVDAPGLVDAVRFGSDGVSGIAIRRFARGHSPGTFSNLYQMSQEGRFVCSLPCAFEEWRSMETLAEERSGDSRFFRWLKRNRLTEDLWVGHAPVSSLSQQCPALDPRRPFEIVLGQADPRADRVVVDLGRSGDEGR